MMSIAMLYDEESGAIKQVWKKFGKTSIQEDALPIHEGSVLIVTQDLDGNNLVQEDLVQVGNQPNMYHIVNGALTKKEL